VRNGERWLRRYLESRRDKALTVFWDTGLRFCTLIGFNRGVASFKSRGKHQVVNHIFLFGCAWRRFCLYFHSLAIFRRANPQVSEGGSSYFYPSLLVATIGVGSELPPPLPFLHSSFYFSTCRTSILGPQPAMHVATNEMRYGGFYPLVRALAAMLGEDP